MELMVYLDAAPETSDLAGEIVKRTDVGPLLERLGRAGRRLTECELTRTATAVAAETALLTHLAGVGIPPARRRFVLHRTENFEVLALVWPPHEASDWHDHGGASGGYAVVEGALVERYRASDGRSVHKRSLVPGSHGGFGASHVHDMVPVSAGATISVHTYSPPIETMTYYAQTPFGFVARAVVAES